MSLINDMLRDLEQRRCKEAQQQPVSVPTAIAKPRRTDYYWLIGMGLLAGVTLLIVLGWFLLPSFRTVAPQAAARPSAAPATLQASEPHSPPTVTAPSADQITTLPASSQPLLAAVNLVEDKDQLLLELTFTHLPDLSEVRFGSEGGRVSILLQDTHITPGLVLPQPRMERISGISLLPTVSGLELIVAIKTQEQPTTTQSLEPRTDRLRIGLTFQPSPGLTEPVAKTAPALAVLEPETKPEVKPEPRRQQEALPTIVRNSPPVETEEQFYQRGLRQLQGGNPAAARQSFAAAVRLNPAGLAARLELIAVLQHLGDKQGALAVLQEGLALQPGQPDLRKLYAHHLILVQRPGDALKVLDVEPLPALKDDPEFHALRAAMYQELGEYARAAEVYAQLLDQRPRESLWWMGLAIALEQQGLNGGAREAYRTALDVRGLRPDLENFVRERLQHL